MVAMEVCPRRNENEHRKRTEKRNREEETQRKQNKEGGKDPIGQEESTKRATTKSKERMHVGTCGVSAYRSDFSCTVLDPS